LKKKKKFIMEFIYCRRLKSQYFGAPKSGASKMRGLPAVAGIAGGVPTPLHCDKLLFMFDVLISVANFDYWWVLMVCLTNLVKTCDISNIRICFTQK